jgi:hypothetical protein
MFNQLINQNSMILNMLRTVIKKIRYELFSGMPTGCQITNWNCKTSYKYTK